MDVVGEAIKKFGSEKCFSEIRQGFKEIIEIIDSKNITKLNEKLGTFFNESDINNTTFKDNVLLMLKSPFVSAVMYHGLDIICIKRF